MPEIIKHKNVHDVGKEMYSVVKHYASCAKMQ